MLIAGRLFKALLVSLLLALSAYGVAKLDLFGLESSSDRLADQVYQRITAADYGRDRRGQQAISVVYLDEASMQAMRSFGWNRFPPTYDQQWTMLDDLMTVGGEPPAALYVDFVYTGQGGPGEGFPTFLAGVAAATHAKAWAGAPGCHVGPLVKIACVLAAGGTPIIFAKPSPTDVPLYTDIQHRLDGIAVLAPAVVGEHAYPLVTHYDFPPQTAASLGVHGFDVSPAMAMYAAWCLRRADACGEALFKQVRGQARAALSARAIGAAVAPAADAAFGAPMDVVWGSRPDPDYLAMTAAVTGRPAPCRGEGAGWRQRLMEQLAGLRGPGTGTRQECPYALTLGYDRMVAGLGLRSGDLKRLLAGRMVMVGGQFRASNDWVESPVHGQAPGVQYHAMALDNLIEDGADYRRNAAMLLDSDLLKSLLVAALAFCGVLGVMLRNNLLDQAVAKGAEARLSAKVYCPLYAMMFATSITVVIVATWVGVTYAHRAPINWIGISFCALGFLFYATRQTLPADIIGSVEHLPTVRRTLALARLARRWLKFEEDRLVAPRRPRPSPPTSATATATAKETPGHAEI
ncbi:MAG TPA: hypothetical protein VGH15_04575 [Caulobacteraceae bacterium]